MDRRQNNGSVKHTLCLAIAQRLVHCAIAVSTAVLGQRHKDNVRCTAVDEQLRQLEAKEVHLPTHDLVWANLKVQLHLPPLRSLDLLISPGTLFIADALDVLLYRRMTKRAARLWIAFVGTGNLFKSLVTMR